MRIRFGDCVFDSLTRQVMRDGRALDLTPKAFDLLSALLASRPRVLSRAELRDQLWPSTFVSYSALSRVVNEVRGAIGDSARCPRLVRTVRGIGYAFGGTALDVPDGSLPGASVGFRLVWGGQEIGLPEGEHFIGRARDCQVWVDSSRVSRRHARIRVHDSEAVIEDLGSKNGTFVKDRRTVGAVRLTDGDQIRVGSSVLTLRAGGGQERTETGDPG